MMAAEARALSELLDTAIFPSILRTSGKGGIRLLCDYLSSSSASYQSMEIKRPILAQAVLATTDDMTLVAAVLSKDRKATAEFVARYTDGVYRYIRGRVPQLEAVEDLVQETFLAAWGNLANFRAEAQLHHWLLGIARHKVEDYYRKRFRLAEVAGDDDSSAEPVVLPKIEEQLDEALQQQRIQQTLASLPEPYGLALLWRYRDGRSIREMADFTGKTEKAMERLLARAREHFRRRWNDAQP
jgi:RNA polymerase sigma-70 factor (ECF subfamily)